jgi:amino acid transporter
VSNQKGGTGAEGEIGLLGALSIGIGGIVGGGIFATLGLAVAHARGSAWLSFLVAGAVALLTAYSYSKLAIAFPSSGGTVAFLLRGYGKGFMTDRLSTLLVLSYIVIMALYANAFSTYAVLLLPAEYAHLQPWLAAAVLILLGLANGLLPAAMDAGEGVLNVVKLVVLGAFIALGLGSGDLSLERLGPASWVGPVNIFVTGMLIFLSYEGFELIANASPRVTDRARNLPLAFYGSVVVAMLLYISIVVVSVGHLPFEQLEAQKNHAISAVAETFMGRFGFGFMAVGAIVAAVSAINADMFGSTRLMGMLSEEGPHRWKRVGTVFGGHPWKLVLLTMAGVIATTTMNLHALSAVSSAGFLMVFAAVNAANARLAKETKSVRWVSLGAAMTCLGALGAMLVQLGGQAARRHEALIIVGMAVLPFILRPADVAIRSMAVRLRSRKGT